MKKRIMLCNEASYLSTGFSTYGLELLRRLNDTGKYELLEYASYSPRNDPRAADLPWAHKSASFDENVPGQKEAFEANKALHFGSVYFEDACLDFRPDFVVDIRDWWMLEHEERSPLRRNYRWAIMPTVDAEPQDEQWLATYMTADAVFAYSDWGLELLRKATAGRMKTRAAAPPGADLVSLRPVADRMAHRAAFGVEQEALIVGTVMRNQRRKLYPELLEAFLHFQRTAPPELVAKTYLYFHTAWPDVGWDIPRLLKETGLGSRVLFTYMCKNCAAVFPSFFHDACMVCKSCGQPAATFPGTHMGIPRAALGSIMNLFDVYVQYANSEGFGMPQVEAASCGIPVMATDYSAMSDVVRKLKGTPIKPGVLARELETHCKRAVPSKEDFAEKLTAFLLKPAPVRSRLGVEARRAVEEHYDWDKTAKLWMDYFDSAEVPDQGKTWFAPMRKHAPNLTAPDNLSDAQFVRWGISQVAGRPDLLDSYTALRMARDLTWGVTTTGGDIYANDMASVSHSERTREFTRTDAVKALLKLAEWTEFWERQRVERCKR